MMVDAALACVGESTVYRVLSEADLLSRWKRSTASSGEYHFRATAPNQQWHTDVMYVWIAARFYFLLSFVDAYSRYVVHHKLADRPQRRVVATELQAALEALQDAKPIIGKLMYHYNEERLHATLGYMRPATWHRGQPEEVRDERARRIAAARAHRKMTNQQRFTEAQTKAAKSSLLAQAFCPS